jgi:hypothetical protein
MSGELNAQRLYARERKWYPLNRRGSGKRASPDDLEKRKFLSPVGIRTPDGGLVHRK